MKQIKLKEKIAIVVGVAMVLTNPLSGQYVLWALDTGFQKLFSVGSYIGLIGTVYLLGLGAIYYWKSEKPNIPAKSKKLSKAGEFIA